MNNLDQFVEGHLDLQVKLSYTEHHDFLLRHGLSECSTVLDIGTGNGTFVAKLASDHPDISFVGIDKRKHCLVSCQKFITSNLSFELVDMFSKNSDFKFNIFDGVLMRYFLLHVDHAQKILDLLQKMAKKPSKMWIIDLDWSGFNCNPQSDSFDKITQLVRDFCSKISVATHGGQNVLPLLRDRFKNIEVEYKPFSTAHMNLTDFTRYLKQEVICYAKMSGRDESDAEMKEMIHFIETDVQAGKYQISYGMILISAELNQDA